MALEEKSILLFNPWIYDFSAYDFWFKPLGLLYIGSILRQLGYRIELLDCLDRFHPALESVVEPEKIIRRSDYSGKFYREIIKKPETLSFVPRHYARYGTPYNLVHKLLLSLDPPAVILITSFMTYWYPAVQDAIVLLRHCFPGAKIILGGIYPTLCPQHAQDHAAPDFVVKGEGEVKAVRLIAELLNGPGADYYYSDLDELPFPAFDLYPQLKTVALLTSRGCPNACSFCASKRLAAGYRRRSVQNIIAEIVLWHQEYDIQHYSFFDDALLHHSSTYFKPLLRRLGNRARMTFYTPNGLTPRYIDEEMAELFRMSGVRHVRLSFETSNERRQKAMSAKVTNSELATALKNFEHAGYETKEIGVYVLMGLPDQTVDEVVESVLFVHRLGARVNMASFSPIPGTLEWQKAVDIGQWEPDTDLLLTNTTIFPIWHKTIGYEKCDELMQWVNSLNHQLAE